MSVNVPPLLADADIGQVVFVLVALVVAFINWLINLWKQKKENAERERRMPTEEEMAENRRIYMEQAKAAPPAPPPQPAPAGGSLKDLFEELKRAAEDAQRPPTPPPMPAAPQRPPYAATSAPTPPPVVVSRPSLPLAPPLPAAVAFVGDATHRVATEKAQEAHSEAARRAAAAYSGIHEPRRKPHPLTALLHTTAGYRQAFVLKEVLDTPKGLRESPWSELP